MAKYFIGRKKSFHSMMISLHNTDVVFRVGRTVFFLEFYVSIERKRRSTYLLLEIEIFLHFPVIRLSGQWTSEWMTFNLGSFLGKSNFHQWAPAVWEYVCVCCYSKGLATGAVWPKQNSSLATLWLCVCGSQWRGVATVTTGLLTSLLQNATALFFSPTPPSLFHTVFRFN